MKRLSLMSVVAGAFMLCGHCYGDDGIGGSVSVAVLSDVLDGPAGAQIDADKFVDLLFTYDVEGLGIHLSDMVDPCLRSVVDGADRVHVCRDFIDAVYENHNAYVRAVNALLNDYVVNGILPGDRKHARTDDGAYYAAYIKIPETVDLSKIPSRTAARLSQQMAVFASGSDAFVCSLGVVWACKPTAQSTYHFQYEYRRGQPNRIVVIDPSTSPDIPIGVQETYFLNGPLQDRRTANWRLNDYGMNAPSDNVSHDAEHPVVASYREARNRAVGDCVEEFRARMPNTPLGHNDLEVSEACMWGRCAIMLQYIDITHTCVVPSYATEYKSLIAEHPEYDIGPYEP